ncbi:kinase-like domain [Purpureocillium lavendulum]|uniref:Kinase-like domain n=1 Tax=Purpureocillium lavendulum TaxID=1247861 RepID=A0AB34FR17_9HYPO|nr:kinase-like domain [Purpureocillium lavendulum]
MKSAIATMGMLAAAASASSHHPRHLHFPRANNTAEQTTLTVIATQIHTVTSCAPTVTNCPAHSSGMSNLPETDKTTFVVTDTVTLATTVCPVTEASSVSASIISQATSSALPIQTSQASIRTTEIHPSVPLSTGVPGATTSKADATLPPGMTTTTTDVVTSKTLTMTLGTGTDASVVTTTIHSTVQQTITVPCSQTDSGNKPTGPAGTGKDDTTTTTTATTKVTRTITVSKATPTPTGGGGIPGNGGDDCTCAAAQTVTVTAPASTVYVTIGGDASPTVSEPAGTGKTVEPTAEPATTSCPDSTTTRQTTVTVVPFPTGNGTHTSGHAGPSGFARLRR